MFHLRGFRNRVIPILTNVMQHSLKVGAEIYALRIAEDLKIAHLAAVRPSA